MVLSIVGIAVFIILFYMNMYVFLYQRTVRSVAIFHNIPIEKLGVFYWKKHRIYYMVSKARWAVIIGLFFVSWIPAVICLVVNFVVPIVYPEPDHDYKLIYAEAAIDTNQSLDNETRELLHTIIDLYRKRISFNNYMLYESLVDECTEIKTKYGVDSSMYRNKLNEAWGQVADKEEFERYLKYEDQLAEREKAKEYARNHPRTHICVMRE